MSTAASDILGNVLDRLQRVRQSGDGKHEALCPAHEDRNASLSVSVGRNGSVLLHCHAGCGTKDICTAIGLELKDLFPPRVNGNANGKHAKHRQIVETYDYHGAEGELLYQSVRYEPKDFSQRRPDRNGGWIWNMDGVTRVLYRLPELLNSAKTRPGEWVFVVEGEKDVLRLAGLGLIATCNVGGASKSEKPKDAKWLDSYSDTLAGRRVALVPDNDPPGHNHMERAARSMHGKAAEIRTVILPGVPPKGDVSDYLDVGATVEDLLRLVQAAPAWTANQVERALSAVPARASSGDDPIFDPRDPLPIAKAFIDASYSHRDGRTIQSDGSVFHVWTGAKYEEVKPAAIRAQAYPWLASLKRRGRSDPVPFAPNQTSVNHFMDALESTVFVGRQSPCWLREDAGLPDPQEVIAATNGLVRLRRDATAELFHQPTPLFFSPNAIDYAYDPGAPMPSAWLRFLTELWEADEEAIGTLQEFTGYLLTPNTSQQKALLLVGPKRAGKGTIARVIRRLLGPNNICGPTLSGLATDFGLWGLLGKLVAIVSDARLSGRADQAAVTERILSLTGEDAIEVHRKFLAPTTVRIPARLVILTNELPKLNDPSGALASRFLVLTLKLSFFGREDTRLEDRLCAELPGILNWAIAGWQRLHRRGHFVQPSSSQNAIDELNDLSSPIGAFIRDWCHVQPGSSCSVSDLFDAWRAWCREQGREREGNQQVFGRDLRAAIPGIDTKQRRTDSGVIRVYEGIDLTATAYMTVAASRSATQCHA